MSVGILVAYGPFVYNLLYVLQFSYLLCTALRAVACESEVLNVQCYDGDRIRVISANYGRRDNVTCTDHLANNIECIYTDMLQFVTDRCALYVLGR